MSKNKKKSPPPAVKVVDVHNRNPYFLTSAVHKAFYDEQSLSEARKQILNWLKQPIARADDERFVEKALELYYRKKGQLIAEMTPIHTFIVGGKIELQEHRIVLETPDVKAYGPRLLKLFINGKEVAWKVASQLRESIVEAFETQLGAYSEEHFKLQGHKTQIKMVANAYFPIFPKGSMSRVVDALEKALFSYEVQEKAAQYCDEWVAYLMIKEQKGTDKQYIRSLANFIKEGMYNDNYTGQLEGGNPAITFSFTNLPVHKLAASIVNQAKQIEATLPEKEEKA